MEQIKKCEFHHEMKQLEQILNAKNSKAETSQHREKGERAGKIKTPRNGDTMEIVTKGSMANKKGHVAAMRTTWQ